MQKNLNKISVDIVMPNYNSSQYIEQTLYSILNQSFKNFNECFESNSIGSKEVFKFCLDNNIKLIYSATSAALGNDGKDKNLSPYAFTKAKN